MSMMVGEKSIIIAFGIRRELLERERGERPPKADRETLAQLG